MPDRITELSTNKIARIVGVAWLAIIVAGIFAEFVVRESLIVAGDPAETVANIVESETLFRISIVGDLVMIAFDVTVAVLLFVLLRSVSPGLAQLTAWFRLVQAAVIGASVLSLSAVLLLVGDGAIVDGFTADQINSLAAMFIEIHSVGYDIALVFFSLSLVVLSYLLFRSGLVPKVLPAMLSAAAVVYMAGSLIHILVPEHSSDFDAAYTVPFIAELTLALWFLIKGIRVPSRNARQLETATDAA